MRIVIESKDHERVVRVWEGVERVSFTQWARLEAGGFVLSFLVQHQLESAVLPPGEYVLDPTSFSTKNGRLSVDRVTLKPAPRLPQSKAA